MISVFVERGIGRLGLIRVMRSSLDWIGAGMKGGFLWCRAWTVMSLVMMRPVGRFLCEEIVELTFLSGLPFIAFCSFTVLISGWLLELEIGWGKGEWISLLIWDFGNRVFKAGAEQGASLYFMSWD